MMNNYSMTHEKLIFEMASGWDFKNTSSKAENVIMRDYFVQIMRPKYPEKEIAKSLGKGQTFVTDSVNRFWKHYDVEKGYKERFNEISRRYDEIEMAEGMI